jgi:hypothetical protein
MKRIALAILAAIALSACSSMPKLTTTKVEYFTSTLREEKAQIVVNKPALLETRVDVPRDQSKLVLDKSANTVCTNQPPEPTDATSPRVLELCYRNPPLTESNIYRGYSEEQWKNKLVNEARIESYVYELEQAIARINKASTEAATYNDQQRQRLACEKQQVEDKKSLSQSCKDMLAGKGATVLP